MNYHREISDTEKLVILFSGGLDSAIAYHYALKLFPENKVTGLFVDIGQPYIEAEMASVKFFKEKTGANITIVHYPFTQEKEYAYEKVTPTNHIIPGRNMTLATIAANFGTTIWVNALYGELKEHMPDKNWVFFNEASRILSYTFGTKITVESPFWYMTKTQTVSLAVDELHISEDILKATNSCYHPKIVNGETYFCGNCLTCFKRKVAMVNNGITEKYIADPFKSWYAKEVYKKIQNGSLEKELIKDYALAFKKEGLRLKDIPNIA